MAKHTPIISLFVALLLALSVTSVSAREFKSTKQKSPKTVKLAAEKNTAPEIKTVEAGRVAKPAHVSHAKQFTAAPVHSTTQKGVYNALLVDQTNLSEQIGVLSSQLQGASAGKAKKIGAQINDLTSKLGAVERQMDAFPESIKNPAYKSVVEVDVEFNKKMDALAAQMSAMTDPYAGEISSDPELEALYRQHLSESGYSTRSGGSKTISGSDGLTYRVMIAISKKALPKSAFAGLSDILEQRMDNGGVIYYQGSYQSVADANKACTAILAAHKFRDAFVVAMDGDRRVSLK